MEVSRRARLAVGREARPPELGALASVLGGGWRLGGFLVGLPWRLLASSLDLAGRALAATGQARARLPAGVAVAPARPAAELSTEEVPIEEIETASAGPARAGETVASGASAGEELPPTSKEDLKMSCNCDQDLSGCELKVVQYTIVSVDPYIKDCHRILAGPNTIATSDDMTDADFTAYVIALFLQEDPPPDIPHCDKQYLRVCYCVQCRLTMPCPDYEKQQVDALRQIARELGDGGGHHDYKLERKEKAPAKK